MDFLRRLLDLSFGKIFKNMSIEKRIIKTFPYKRDLKYSYYFSDLGKTSVLYCFIVLSDL